jgi:hypothetical protein
MLTSFCRNGGGIDLQFVNCAYSIHSNNGEALVVADALLISMISSYVSFQQNNFSRCNAFSSTGIVGNGGNSHGVSLH